MIILNYYSSFLISSPENKIKIELYWTFHICGTRTRSVQNGLNPFPRRRRKNLANLSRSLFNWVVFLFQFWLVNFLFRTFEQRIRTGLADLANHFTCNKIKLLTCISFSVLYSPPREAFLIIPFGMFFSQSQILQPNSFNKYCSSF